MYEFKRIVDFVEVNRFNASQFDQDSVARLHHLVGELLINGKFRNWGVRALTPVAEKERVRIPLSNVLTRAQQDDICNEFGVGKYIEEHVVEKVEGFDTKVKRPYYVFFASDLRMRHVVPLKLKALLGVLVAIVLALAIMLLVHNSKYVRV